MAFDGSIEALIGADLTEYDKAMNEVVNSTKKAFETAAQSASKSANQMIREVGELMNRLASNNQSIGSKIGQGLTGGVKIAMGELQRIASNIGAKLPEPLRNGLIRLSNDIKGIFGTMKNEILSFGSKVNSGFKKAFSFDIANAIKSPKSAFAEMANSIDSMATRISSKAHSIGSVFANSAKNMSGPYKTAFNGIANSLAAFEARVLSAAQRVTSSLGQRVLNPINSSWSSLFSGLTTKVNGFADRVSNSFGGRLLSATSKLATHVGGTLGNAFQTTGQKAVSALTGIVSHTNSAASASSGLLKQVIGVAAAYKAFDLGKQAIKSTISKAAEFEAKMSNIKAVTGESAETMKKFNDAAIKAGADTAFSAAEAADAVGELAKAGVSTQDILNGGLTASLNLATAGELDLKEAAEITSTALNAFRRDGMTATQAANQLAGAANASATDVHELKYGLSMVAPVASGLGLSFRDTTNALAVFAQNGLKGSDAGTSLKTMLMNLQPSTKGQYEAMHELGIITKDGANQFFTAEGKIKSFAEISQVLKDKLGHLTDAEKQMALKTLFGTDAVRAATIAMNEGAEGANNMQAAIDKVTAAQVAAEKLNNLKGAIEALSGSFETLQIKVGTAVLPVLTTLVKYVDKLVDKISNSKGLQTFLDALNSLNPALNQFLNGTKMTEEQAGKFESVMVRLQPAIAGVVGAFAFGPATKGLSKMTGLLGELGGKVTTFGNSAGLVFGHAGDSIINFTSKIGGVPAILGRAGGEATAMVGQMSQGISSVMSVALAAIGPTAILGLVVAGLGIINNQFGTQIDQLLNTVTTKGPQIIQNLVSGITSQIPALIASGADLIAKFASAFATMFPVLVQAGVDLIGSLVQGVGQNATSLISSAVTVIGTFVQSIASALPQLLSMGVELLANLVQGVLNNLPQILQSAQQAVTTFLTGLGQQMPSIIQNGIQIQQNLINGIIQSLPTILQIAVQVITSFIQGLVSNLPAIIQGGIQLIVSLVTGLIQNLPQIIASAAQIVSSLVSGLMQATPQLIQGGLQLIAQLVISLIAGLPKILEAGAKIIFELGKAMLTAVPEAIGGVVSAVGDFFGGMWDFVTGKTTEGSEVVKAKTTEMSDHVSAKTTEMSTNATLQAQTMQTNVGLSMDAMNLDTQTKVNTMSTNVDTSMQGLAAAAGIDMQMFSSNVSTNMQQAQTTATTESATMNANVSSNLSGLNTSASSYLQALQVDSNTAFQTVQSNASAISSSTAAAVSGNYSTMSGNATGSANSMQGSTTSAFSTMQSNAESSSQAVANAVTSNFKNAETAAKNAMNGVSKAVTDGMNKVTQAATSGGNKMAQTFDSALNKVKSYVQQGMTAVSSAFNSGMNQAVSISSSANSQIVSIFNTLASHLYSVGVHAGSGLYNGLASMAGSLYSLAYSIASNIASVMRSALDIHSPSRVMKSIGGFTGEGMYIGMSDWVRRINGVAKQYAMAITDQSYGVDSLITTSASVNNTGLKSSLENLSDDVKNSQLSNAKFEVHNEIVGDKIYTTIKEKDAREQALSEYFA
ncbi:phage tail tape measure protein [Streptococcus infantis]|nr:phage tail tape measure protein [Streptococcus infantis]MBZ2111734.1 phage tail tape measure protein [Streptococcus infantis]